MTKPTIEVSENGDIVVTDHSDLDGVLYDRRIYAAEKPALLVALLEDAGAVKVETKGTLNAGTIWTKDFTHLPIGDAWLLLVPEDTA